MKLILDLDGTLFRTMPCAVEGIGYLFDKLGLPRPDESKIYENIGLKSDEFLKLLLPDNITYEPSMLGLYREAERRAVCESGKLFDGVIEVLERLRNSGHELIICSNGSEEYIKLVMNSTNISFYFDGVYSARNYSSKSKAIASCIGNNMDCVVIGDTMSDINAAHDNSLPVILAEYGYGGSDAQKAADFIARIPSDITSLVARISVFAEVEKLFKARTRIIGINGVDTSGKTQFTDCFSRYLCAKGRKATVLHLDDFHNPSAVRRQGLNEQEAYYNNAFNTRQAVEEVLAPLRKNGSVDREILCLDPDTDKYEAVRRYTVEANGVLLVEGILLFRPPLDEFFNLRIFLDISFEEVLHRATVRDVLKYGEEFLQKYIDKYIPGAQRYFSEWKPSEHSDIVVDNNDWRYPKVNK